MNLDKKTLLAGGIGVLLVGVVFFGTSYFMNEQKPQENNAAATEDAAQATAPALSDLPLDTKELYVEDVVKGSGKEAKGGSRISVHYTGLLTDGTVFDSSLRTGQPFTFNLGAGEVIPGFDEGISGMKVGGKRILVIPSDLAYGANGVGPIPPNATLIFEIDLVSAVDGQ